jgi:hypothetical protein
MQHRVGCIAWMSPRCSFFAAATYSCHPQNISSPCIWLQSGERQCSCVERRFDEQAQLPLLYHAVLLLQSCLTGACCAVGEQPEHAGRGVILCT